MPRLAHITLSALLASHAVACAAHMPPSAVPAASLSSAQHESVASGTSAPNIGEGSLSIEAYLLRLEDEVAAHRERYADMRRSHAGSDEELDALYGRFQEAKSHHAAERSRLHPDESDGNVGMVVAGGILTGLGGLAEVGGLGVAIAGAATGGEVGPYLFPLIGLPLILGGGVFLGIGIPLIVAGLPDEPSGVPAPFAAPELRFGPGGVTSTWRF